MAIIKQAKNIRINVKNNYTSVSGSLTETADSITIEATDGNLTLASNKKVIVHGEQGIKFGTYEPKKVVTEENGLFVSEIKWRGKKDNYVSSVYRKDIMLNHSIDLEVITTNFSEGDSFELTVRQSNGRRIKGQSTEFSVSGSVDADGLTTIPNFKVECDFKEDNQDFGDIIFYHKEHEIAWFKENFGWTYIKEREITKVFVNIDFNAAFIPMGYTEVDIKEAINSSFKRTLENSSGKSVTGKIFFNGKYIIELPQYVPKMQVVKGISGNGMIYMGVVTAEVNEGGSDILIEMSETAVHELLHSVRLDHPFDRIQSNDTFLFNDGFRRYGTSLATDANIYYNIMLYNFCIINGHRLDNLWKTKRPEYLTKGQLQLMFKEIDLQQKGAGTHQNMNISDLFQNQEEIDIVNDNAINPDQWSAFDWYWNISIPGKRMKGYQHRETRTNPN